MLAAATVAAFASCAKELDNPEETSGRMKTITVKTDIATKTTLDANHANLVWSTGDKISLFNDFNDTNTEVAYSQGGDITVSVPVETKEIYMHYPYFDGNDKGPTEVSVYISNAQTQTNPGELNGYNFPMVAKGTVSADNKALVQFYPVAGALALNIYKATLGETETVESVKVTPASTNSGFYGSQSTDITADDVKYTTAGGTGAVTVTLTNGLSLSSTAPSNKQTFDGQIYVCLAKQAYAGVKFEIKTDKGTYTITSNSTAFDLVNNDFVPVNINLAKAQFEAKPTTVDPTAFSWELVKDALNVGDKVVIAAAKSAFAMSTTQNNNNRGQIAITKSGTILTAVDNVQVFQVVAGSKNNTIALKCLNGDKIGQYISAASSSNNNMHSVDAIDDNSSWSISINETSGIASVIAQGSYTKNIIKFNSSNGTFSCYGSNNTMADVVFYRSTLPSANLSFPEASYSVNIGDSFAAPTLSNPNSVSVAYSSSDNTIAEADESTGTVTIKKAGTVTITASFSGNSTYGASSASYVLTITDPNAVDFVTLPWDYAGGTAADLEAETGVSVNGLGSDYAEANAPYLVKFDGNGDYIQIKTDKAISTVSVGYKMIGGGNTSHLYIFESADGTTWNEKIDDLTISGSQNSTGTVTTTADFNSSSRFVKIVFQKGSNVGIGPISIQKANTDPIIVASNVSDFAAAGGSSTFSYTVKNFTDDVEVGETTGCVSSASVSTSGTVTFTITPNYDSSAASGTIVLQSSANNTITKTVNVSQLSSSLSVSVEEIIIPATSTTATFTVTSAQLGYNAVVATTETGMNLSVSGGASGSASENAQTVTISSTIAAPTSGDAITLGTISVYRNNNSSDPQIKTITVKKAVAGATTYTVTFTSSTQPNNQSYTSSYTVTIGNNTWTVAGFNNNNNSWSGQIKCGRKSYESVATIVTDAALPEAIKTVKITISALTTSSINSITLYSSSNGSSWTAEGSFKKAIGEQAVTIANPTANKYYKLEFDCAAGTSNGLLTLSKVVYTTN